MEKNIERVVFGKYEFDAWYPCVGYFDPDTRSLRPSRPRQPASLWPADGSEKHVKVIPRLFVCHYCFKYTVTESDMYAHEQKCVYAQRPPGKLVYNSRDYSIYCVDGSKHKMFCQCLSLFGKLFLDSKSIYFAVEGFDFFLLVERETDYIAGFFSKEKISWHDYNLACILVFPPFQKLGLGRLLISYAYYLTRKEGKVSAPEKPLSVHGYKSYLRYWQIEAAKVVKSWIDDTISINEISEETGIEPRDVVEALENMDVGFSQNDPKILVHKVLSWAQSHCPQHELLDERCCILK